MERNWFVERFTALCAERGTEVVVTAEASHGTHEYYTWRARISRRLIEEKGFSLHRRRGRLARLLPRQPLRQGLPGLRRHARRGAARLPPLADLDVGQRGGRRLAEWLRRHNERSRRRRRSASTGWTSTACGTRSTRSWATSSKHDPAALAAARRAFRCFEPYGEDAQEYARATRLGAGRLRGRGGRPAAELRAGRGGRTDGDGRDAHFNAEQNALVVKNAEAYYRTMVRGGPESWNVRDRHMAETLDRLMRHHGPRGQGDRLGAQHPHRRRPRYTDMADDGMVNVGQLVREGTRRGVVLVGFGSYQGTVIAGRSGARRWRGWRCRRARRAAGRATP